MTNTDKQFARDFFRRRILEEAKAGNYTNADFLMFELAEANLGFHVAEHEAMLYPIAVNEVNAFNEDEAAYIKDTPTCDYIINVANNYGNLEPTVAVETEFDAILLAKEIAATGKTTEVVYMPEYDADINEVIWKSDEKR